MKVLKAALDSIDEESGGEFGYASDVKVEGLSKKQVSGYLSQLVQKGYLTILTEFHSYMEATDKCKDEIN